MSMVSLSPCRSCLSSSHLRLPRQYSPQNRSQDLVSRHRLKVVLPSIKVVEAECTIATAAVAVLCSSEGSLTATPGIKIDCTQLLLAQRDDALLLRYLVRSSRLGSAHDKMNAAAAGIGGKARAVSRPACRSPSPACGENHVVRELRRDVSKVWRWRTWESAFMALLCLMHIYVAPHLTQQGTLAIQRQNL